MIDIFTNYIFSTTPLLSQPNNFMKWSLVCRLHFREMHEMTTMPFLQYDSIACHLWKMILCQTIWQGHVFCITVQTAPWSAKCNTWVYFIGLLYAWENILLHQCFSDLRLCKAKSPSLCIVHHGQISVAFKVAGVSL